jgi:uncharacterized protein YidB (DUF937 family)
MQTRSQSAKSGTPDGRTRKRAVTFVSIFVVVALASGLVIAGSSVLSARERSREVEKVRELGVDPCEEMAVALGITTEELRTKLESGKTIEQIAKEQGVDLNALSASLKRTISEALNLGVSEGKITQEEADKVMARLDEMVKRFIDRGPPKPNPGEKVRELGVDPFAETATALGMTAEDLQKELKSGKTIEQIAKEKGISLDTVSAALKQTISDALAKAVADGKMTQEEADKITAHLDKMVKGFIDHGPPKPNPVEQLGELGIDVPGEMATALGMTAEDLQKELKSGKTIEQIAKEKGISLDTVSAALKQTISDALAKAVADGKMTQEEADRVTSRLDDMVMVIEQGPPKREKQGPQGQPGQQPGQQPDQQQGPQGQPDQQQGPQGQPGQQQGPQGQPGQQPDQQQGPPTGPQGQQQGPPTGPQGQQQGPPTGPQGQQQGPPTGPQGQQQGPQGPR